MLTCLKLATVFLTLLVSTSGMFFYNFYNQDIWKVNEERLPGKVTPSFYVLKLTPYINDGIYNGSVRIYVRCIESTSSITLHADEGINIQHENINVVGNALDDLSIQNITRNSTTQMLTIHLNGPLQEGDLYRLTIEFGGSLIGGGRRGYRYRTLQKGGFFRATYDNRDTRKQSWYATFMTTPKFARSVFPCFDEPSFKAPFKISVERPNNMSTISVMPIKSTEKAQMEGWEWDHFEVTPPLSTFSLNVIVSDFISEPPVNVSTNYGNITVCYHHRKNQYRRTTGNTTVNSVAKLINYLQDYMQTPYPLSKLDIVSLPQYHYGLQESSLGIIAGSEFDTQMQNVMLLPGMIDQWLAHMVTPRWWTDFNVTNMLTFHLLKGGMLNTTTPVGWFSSSQRTHIYNLFSHKSKSHQYRGMRRTYNFFIGEWFFDMLNSTLSEKTLRTGISKYLLDNALYFPSTDCSSQKLLYQVTHPTLRIIKDS